MRHLKAGRALGVKPAHRRAMMRNLVSSLIEQEQIKTTLARAKEMRTPLDHMITLGKKGDLSARRQALAFVKGKVVMAKLFGELAERYTERAGGFSRILRLGPRRGDGAEMVMILLVGNPNDPFADEKKPSRKGPRKKATEVLDEVAEEVSAKKPAEKKEGEADEAAASEDSADSADSAETGETATPEDSAPGKAGTGGEPEDSAPGKAEAEDSDDAAKK